MRAWRHRRSRRSGWVSSAGILSCQVETPLRVFLYSCGTSYLRFRPAAVLQCTACGRMPGSTTDQSGAGGRCVHNNHRARTAGGWVEDRVREGTRAS